MVYSNPTDDPISAFLRDKYTKENGRFNKSGMLISYHQWTRLMNTPTYTRVARDVLDDGTEISTVWLGFYDNRFETMVFAYENLEEYAESYDTEGQAIEGHKRAVANYKNM